MLLRRINTSLGTNGTAIQWFLLVFDWSVTRCSSRSIVRLAYHKDRRWGLSCSLCTPPTYPSHRAPQSSSASLCGRYSVHGSCSPADFRQLQPRVSLSFDDIARLMQSNRLKLNTDKTDVLLVCYESAAAPATNYTDLG
jgi:hypothetical protein